jgi:hypothetical protein
MTNKQKLEEIEKAIRDYHYALDTRQHGGVAQDVAFNKISQIMGIYWQQGKEYELRKKESQKP